MSKRQIIVSAVTSIVLLLIGAAGFQALKNMKTSTVSNKPVAEKIIYVTTAQYPLENIKSELSIDGRLNAYEKITVSAEANGKLENIAQTWREGSYFSKGDLLFQVESTDEKLNIYALRSSLLTAITQIMPDLKFDFPQSFDKWKTYLDAFEIEKTTQVLPEISNQQEKYYVAGKNIYNLYYTIKSAEEKLNNYKVIAPFSGVFMTVNAYPGSLVSPGTALATIMNTSKYELQTPISMNDFGLVKTGQKVNLNAADLGQSYTGTISRIGQQIDQTTQSIPVFISVSGKGLRDGMYLNGKLQGNAIADVTAIPLETIVGQSSIYIVQDSLVVEKPVEIILRTDDKAIVKGVQPSDDIIIKGLNSISPGQKAAISKI